MARTKLHPNEHGKTHVATRPHSIHMPWFTHYLFSINLFSLPPHICTLMMPCFLFHSEDKSHQRALNFHKLSLPATSTHLPASVPTSAFPLTVSELAVLPCEANHSPLAYSSSQLQECFPLFCILKLPFSTGSFPSAHKHAGFSPS